MLRAGGANTKSPGPVRAGSLRVHGTQQLISTPFQASMMSCLYSSMVALRGGAPALEPCSLLSLEARASSFENFVVHLDAELPVAPGQAEVAAHFLYREHECLCLLRLALAVYVEAHGPGQVGKPRKRLKLRSAMHNYVSCLGTTTPPITPTKGSNAPNVGKKRFSLGYKGRTHKKRFFFGV